MPSERPPEAGNLFAWSRRTAQRARKSEPGLQVTGLFAGVGGLELGMSRSGHEAALLCEIEATACAVLRARFPKLKLHDDVRTLKQLPAGTSLLAAGFPCQDLSQAGKTAGIKGARSGLVGEVFRLIEKADVRWVLLENVPFMLKLAKGQAMEVVVSALEELGFRWAYRIIDSRAFGLPQRRERVFLLASRTEDPRGVLLSEDQGAPEGNGAKLGKVAHGFYWTEGVRGLGWAVDAVPTLKGGSTIGIPSQPAILLPNGEVVKPDIRDAERMQGFEAGWTEPAEQVAKKGMRWKLVGNAVSVDVAQWIGEQLRSVWEYDALGDAPLRKGSAWPRAAWGSSEGRFSVDVSSWPVRRPGPRLHEFLRYPVTLLSAKATAGFLGRTKLGTLRFPEGFIPAVKAHLDRMRASES